MLKRIFIALVLTVVAGLSAAQSGKVLGQLGQTLEKSKIYKSPSSKASVYYTAKQYEYLVVKPAKSGARYHTVVMKSTRGGLLSGYIRTENVALLPQQVVTSAKAPASTGSSATRGGDRAAAAAKGLNYIGTPYVWGGNDITGGIDCSAFVKKLMGEIGMNLPRTAAEQAKVGTPITRLEELQPGDRLYFWEKKRNTIGHTGIYLGNGYFVHSSRGRNGVATDVLSEKWRRILVAARR
jgi:cell wall-associated NlpC family hydrolase